MTTNIIPLTVTSAMKETRWERAIADVHTHCP